MATRTQTSSVLGLSLSVLVAMSLGCSSLQTQSATADLSQQVNEVQAGPVDEVIVVLRSGREREFLKAPLEGSMLVQDALKGTGATTKFNRMDVVLIREVPAGGKLRMDVPFNPSTRRVADGANYALHPGDIVEVTQDTSTIIDRLFDNAINSLGPITHDYRR